VVEKLEDILTRVGDKIGAGDKSTAGQGGAPRLLPERHPNRDFFVADILDWALKDDRHSMEHPIFSLSKIPISEYGITNTTETAYDQTWR
jgi:hypothetical protein